MNRTFKILGTLAGTFTLIVAVGLWILATSCGIVPPSHFSKPSVLVQCHLPDDAPDGNGYLFIKTVTQLQTKQHYVTVVLGGHWETWEVPVWTKAFLCRVSADGKNRNVISEIPAELLDIAPYEGGFVYRLQGFKVSKDGHKAIILTALDHLVSMNLGNYKSDLYPTNSFAPGTPLGPWLAVSPDRTAFAFLAGKAGLVVCDFNGNARSVSIPDSPFRLYWSKDKNLIALACMGSIKLVDPATLKVVVDSCELEKPKAKELSSWTNKLRVPWLPDELYISKSYSPDARYSTGPYHLVGRDSQFALLESSSKRDGLSISPKSAADTW